MTLKGDLLIRGGTVVDPARNFFGKGDILVHGEKIIDISSGQDVEAVQVIEADNHLVLPGLIDFHTHLYHGGTEIGVYPDSALLPQGVTTAVDQGSAGPANFEGFLKTVVASSQVRIFSTLHSSPAGLATLTKCLEPVNPSCFSVDNAAKLFKKYSKQLLGLKIRQSTEVVGEWGLAPLKATIEMAETIGCRVVVHTTNPPGDIEDLLALLRPGDVFTHVYQGKGSTIIDKKGKVRKAFHEAKDNGVIFDTADGRGHYAFSVIQAALKDGFEPDVISTDLVRGNVFDRAVFGLPLIMSKFLALGLPLEKVVKACTAAPAHILGLDNYIGTLAPGAAADIAVFELRDKPLKMQDVHGDTITCKQIFIPQMTVRNGRVIYRNLAI
jgi:predicted amidohydrolase